METESTRNRNGSPVDGLEGRALGPVLGFMRSLWGVNHALESTSRRMKVRIGVTGPERMVLRLVGSNPGIAAGELAHILRVHPSTLTGLLKRLVRRGLLVRRSDASDARRALFSLGAKGASVDRLKRGTVEAAVRGALGALPDRDVKVAASVLDALAAAMERAAAPSRRTSGPR
jgi:DNA-binding MarR family transcriptional regulator